MRSYNSITIEEVRNGLPFSLYNEIKLNLKLSNSQLNQLLQVSNSKLLQRKKTGHFNLNESDKLARIIRLFDQATLLFEGDKDAAADWLHSPCNAFNDKAPLEHIDSEFGARKVEYLIHGLEYGEFQ